MLGGSKAVVMAAKGGAVTVVEGTVLHISSDYYGYHDGAEGASAIGSVYPQTFNGANIEGIYYIDGTVTDQFVVVLTGNLAQSFFTDVTPQAGSTYTSASATHLYSASFNKTTWSWSGVTVPARWDGLGTSAVIFTT